MDSDSFWKSNWRKSNYAQSTLWFSFSFVFSDLTNPWKNSKNAEHPMEHKEISGNSLSYCSQWILYVLHIRLTQVGSGYRRREISQPTWFRWFFFLVFRLLWIDNRIEKYVVHKTNDSYLFNEGLRIAVFSYLKEFWEKKPKDTWKKSMHENHFLKIV